MLLECLKAILYGIVEGITEWLPISSTGHLILFADRLPFAFSQDQALLAEFWELFEVVIQLGAVLAVAVLLWRRLFPLGKHSATVEKRSVLRLWGRVLAACAPGAILGIGLDLLLERLTQKDLDDWLYNPVTVAVALIVYGVAFLFLERRRGASLPRISFAEEVGLGTALGIGCFQALAIIPGTSRSGATILGAMLLGLSRSAGAEFSFFMAIPTMAGAGAVKLLGFFEWVGERGAVVPPRAWLLLLIGCAVSFLVSLVAIRFL